MKLNFESNLEYQIQAINSIVNLFEGQIKDEGVFNFSFDLNDNTQFFKEINCIRNNLTITPDQIYDNLCKIQNLLISTREKKEIAITNGSNAAIKNILNLQT